MIHRSDKGIRARSSVDRDLVLRNPPVLLCSPWMKLSWRVNLSVDGLFQHLRRSFAHVARYNDCGLVKGNSSRTLSRDVYKLTMQSMIDNLSTKSEPTLARLLRRKEITFLLFRGRVKGACMCAASGRVVAKRASQLHNHRFGAHLETFLNKTSTL